MQGADARRRCKIWRFGTFSGDVKGSEFGVEVLLHSYTHIYIDQEYAKIHRYIHTRLIVLNTETSKNM